MGDHTGRQVWVLLGGILGVLVVLESPSYVLATILDVHNPRKILPDKSSHDALVATEGLPRLVLISEAPAQ